MDILLNAKILSSVVYGPWPALQVEPTSLFSIIIYILNTLFVFGWHKLKHSMHSI